MFNEKLGHCRGTGVVEWVEGEWKIAHYALTMLVPNAIAAEVGSQTIEADKLLIYEKNFNSFNNFSVFTFTSCTQQDVVKNQPKELLYVWLHDVGFEDPNFLAVINADSESENYGELVDTIPVFETVGMATIHQYFCQAQA